MTSFAKFSLLKAKQSRTDTQENKTTKHFLKRRKDSVYHDGGRNVRCITYNDVRTWVLCDETLFISDKRQ